MIWNITQDEISALGIAIELALQDQRHYLKTGAQQDDHGEEWPEVAAAKAITWEKISAACLKMAFVTLADDCRGLSLEFYDSI